MIWYFVQRFVSEVDETHCLCRPRVPLAKVARPFVLERILPVVLSRFLVSHRLGFVRPLDRRPVCRRHLAGGRGMGGREGGEGGEGQQAAATNKNEKTKQERCVLVSRSVPYKKF